MDESILKNRKPGNPEQLAARVAIAAPKDWKEYKELRLLAITGKDKIFFGRSAHPEEIEAEKKRTNLEWQNFLSQENRFTILSWEDSQVTGTGMAKKREEEKDWWMGAGYVREEFRGKGIGKKIFATRLNEIRSRGGTKVRIGVNVDNDRSIHIAELFGFKKVEESATNKGFEMELKDVNDPEVIKKIDAVLNAG